MEQLTKST